jgi:DNA-cytosine methyltransferase
MGLKVVDLYCGAGGFSEGFREVGFEIVAGFDIWEDARTTFRRNHPAAWVPDEYVDIPRYRDEIVSSIRKRFDKIDVIIGGPPCVEFSASKNGGRGNFKEGLQQVKAFLDVVSEIEPSYWVMENVPRIEGFLDRAIESGYIHLPKWSNRLCLDSQYHNVPQARRRLFTGDFPSDIVVELEKKAMKPMRLVLEGLPDCGTGPSGSKVVDPLYPVIHIDDYDLTDHFQYGRYLKLTELEKRMNIDLKKCHRQYGKMPFPDNPDSPSRTIMAAQFAVSRESIIVRDSARKNAYRRLTPRECASLQGYPITYQFWGGSVGSQFRLIGNSVPVGTSRDIAAAILRKEGARVRVRPRLVIGMSGKSPQPRLPPRTKHVLHRNFHWHPVMSMRRGCRVDLDNTGRYVEHKSDFPRVSGLKHACRWDAVLHAGIGRPRWKYELVTSKAIKGAISAVDLGKEEEHRLLKKVMSLHGNVPDASSLLAAHMHPDQNHWRVSMDGVERPRSLLDKVDEIRKTTVGDSSELVECQEFIGICPPKGLPRDVIVASFILYWMCREINCCTNWALTNKRMPSAVYPSGHAVCMGVLSTEFPAPMKG